MSNLWINWRFGSWHFQIVQRYDWLPYIRRGQSPVTFSFNPYQAERRRDDKSSPWFERY